MSKADEVYTKCWNEAWADNISNQLVKQTLKKLEQDMLQDELRWLKYTKDWAEIHNLNIAEVLKDFIDVKIQKLKDRLNDKDR